LTPRRSPAAAVLDAARAAGVEVSLSPQGRLWLDYTVEPPPSLVDGFRLHREEIVGLVAADKLSSALAERFGIDGFDGVRVMPPRAMPVLWDTGLPAPAGAWCRCCGTSSWWRAHTARAC
jgi:hypothetical protein